ncbi:pyridoxal phosphate-dependent aminotransferase [Longimycelium tulufanense]|uniref:Pyridoxal phosphate-dependent aminotransferase n=1 Tax=Longimycelium tulufanense TaxID=907463 RepID=A0A8J3C791_9PSEU|nr:DegT/DnrJ/EryC1/StrS family aminotransferase [Longimycelium tulufanense]GGM47854.1 pyridoxal phosphate-dependent aminotransferase [Longimycelium tulufanense]
MSHPPIPLGQPTVGDAELAAVAEVFRSGWLAGAGPTCRRFEERLADRTGTRHALATANCGAALHLALLALGALPEDEVIVADYTFPATGHAVVWTGATPVFVDVRPDIWTIDPDAVNAAVTSRTIGIIAVDSFGQPADYDELRAIADRHGLFLMEDAACAAGATYRDRPAGALADVATFSFHGRKGITAGEGGALVTDDGELATRARTLHSYGVEPALDRAGSVELAVPMFSDAGHNYRMSDVAAGVLLAQLDRLPELLTARQRVARAYTELLGDVEQVRLPVELPDRTHPWQSYVLTLTPETDRDAVARHLRQHGVQCTFGTYASHLQPVYGRTDPCPVSADLFRRHLAIPMHANLTDDQVEQAAAAVRAAVAAARPR